MVKPATNGRRIVKLSSLLILVTIALVLLHFVAIKKVHAEKIPAPKPAQTPTSQQLASMAGSINSIVNSDPDIDVGVSIINLNDNQSQQYGVTDPFEAASTAKLITAADYLHHVEAGSASLGDSVNGATAQYELQQMIEVSDDNAWLAFNDLLGHPDLQNYASSIGLTNYDPDLNTLPASDIATLLQKLYEGKLLNSSDTRLLLSYMAAANYSDYIGGVVPGNVKFYHKAGVLDDRIHDAAIIDNGKNPIVLVIFTKNESDESDAAPDQVQIIQQISTAVFNAYSI
jgi:beta-lactamase class A